LKRVFYGMDRRTGNISGMGNAVETLEENYDILFQDFKEFYGELEIYAKNRLPEILAEVKD